MSQNHGSKSHSPTRRGWMEFESLPVGRQISHLLSMGFDLYLDRACTYSTALTSRINRSMADIRNGEAKRLSIIYGQPVPHNIVC